MEDDSGHPPIVSVAGTSLIARAAAAQSASGSCGRGRPCTVLAVEVHEPAWLFLIGHDGAGGLLRVPPSGCRAAAPPLEVLRPGRTLRLHEAEVASGARDAAPIRTFFVVAVTGRRTAEALAELLDELPDACRQGRPAPVMKGVREWLARLDRLAGRGDVDWRAVPIDGMALASR